MRDALILLCLGSTLTACTYTDSGSGTKTLLAIVRGNYRPDHGRLDFNVELSRNSLPSPAAVITLVDSDSKEAVTLQDQGSNNRRTEYQGELAGYHRRLELKITSTNGSLDAKLEGPGPHVVIEPLNQAQVSRADVGSNLTIAWRVEDGVRADAVDIENEWGAAIHLSEDTGKAETSAAAIRPGPTSFNVARTNNVELGGGAPGSQFSISYEVRSHFTIN